MSKYDHNKPNISLSQGFVRTSGVFPFPVPFRGSVSGLRLSPCLGLVSPVTLRTFTTSTLLTLPQSLVLFFAPIPPPPTFSPAIFPTSFALLTAVHFRAETWPPPRCPP